MKQTIEWCKASSEPMGDLYNALVAIKEKNPNFGSEVYEKLGIPCPEFLEMVVPAVYVATEKKWMSHGRDVTANVQYWTIVKHPNFKNNPTDNTITIHKAKDNWNREEFIKILKEALKQSKEQYSRLDIIGEDKWIEENL